MDSKDLTKVQRDREEKLKILREKGFNYPNKFEKKDYLGEISSKFSSKMTQNSSIFCRNEVTFTSMKHCNQNVRRFFAEMLRSKRCKGL